MGFAGLFPSRSADSRTRNRRIAGGAAVLVLALLAVVTWRATRPVDHSEALARLARIETSPGQVTADDLIALGGLLRHPDADVRGRANVLFTGAGPDVTAGLGDRWSQLTPDVRSRVLWRMTRENPRRAVELVLPDLAAGVATRCITPRW